VKRRKELIKEERAKKVKKQTVNEREEKKQTKRKQC
jgi:hypothetical protein